jgi:hypothetical protein
MTKRERLAARFVHDVVAGGGDRRRMSNVTKSAFTVSEREELAAMAREALITLVSRTNSQMNGTGLGKQAMSVVLTNTVTAAIIAGIRR